MENLIIIGNGFDLAHDLNTSYRHFYEDMNRKVHDSPNDYRDLVMVQSHNNKYSLKHKNVSGVGNRMTFWDNVFFQIVHLTKPSQLWSDLEYLYFCVLKNYGSREYFQTQYGIDFNFGSAQKVNEEFWVIKGYLEKYLTEEQKRFKKIDGYTNLFSEFSKRRTSILNFNYTNTVQNYIDNFKSIDLIQIHGALNNDVNPLIFGYAASDEESKALVDRNEDELLTNIKRINYKLTENEPRLIEFLETSKEVEVFIMGHSCGISDRLILSQIFNHKNVKTIRVFHFAEMMGYRKTSIGIDRIIDDYTKVKAEKQAFSKLLNYPQCHPMLQYNSNKDDSDRFVNYIKAILKEKEDKRRAEEANRQAVYSALSR